MLVRRRPPIGPVATPRDPLRSALYFAASTTNHIDFGSDTAHDDLPAGTTIFIAKTDSGVTGNPDQCVLCKTASGYNNLIIKGDGTRFRFDINRVTTDLSIVAPGTLQAGLWNVGAVTWDINRTDSDQYLYSGLYMGQHTVLSEPSTYSGRVVGSGAMDTDASVSLVAGNLTPSDTLTLQGSLALIARFNRQLRLDEIRDFVLAPYPIRGCILLAFPGQHGNQTVIDYSGRSNHGAVNGATVRVSPLGTVRDKFVDAPTILKALGAAGFKRLLTRF